MLSLSWLWHRQTCPRFVRYAIGLHCRPSPVVGARTGAATATRAHTQGRSVGDNAELAPVYAANEDPETLRGVDLIDKMSNRWFLDPIFRGEYPAGLFADARVAPPPMQEGDLAIIATPIDFLGINNYSRTLIRARGKAMGVGDDPMIAMNISRGCQRRYIQRWDGKCIPAR